MLSYMNENLGEPGIMSPNVQWCRCMQSVYQAFPHVSTASDKHWGEKAWVTGLHQPVLP